MRNTSLFIGLIMTLFSINSYGRDSTNVKLGFVAGFNSSHPLSPIGIDQFKALKGFYLGASAKVNLSKRIQWKPEILFSLQGFRHELVDITVGTPEGPMVGTFKYTVSELTIAMPLLFQYSICNSFYVQGGPQLGYIVDRRQKTIENSLPKGMAQIESTKHQYDKFDFGLVAGMGYEIGQRFDINVRYFLALKERENFHRSSVYSLGMGYWLRHRS